MSCGIRLRLERARADPAMAEGKARRVKRKRLCNGESKRSTPSVYIVARRGGDLRPKTSEIVSNELTVTSGRDLRRNRFSRPSSDLNPVIRKSNYISKQLEAEDSEAKCIILIEATTAPQRCERRGEVDNAITDEIEEFFLKAEKQMQKRFRAKYNYDVVNDLPLEGRYDWTPLQTASTKEEATSCFEATTSTNSEIVSNII